MVTVLRIRINASLNTHQPWKINDVYWQGFVKCVYFGETILGFNNYMCRQKDTCKDDLVNWRGGGLLGVEIIWIRRKKFKHLQ